MPTPVSWPLWSATDAAGTMFATAAMTGNPFIRQGQPLQLNAAYTPLRNQVLVTFNEAVKMTTAVTGALHLANYAITDLEILSVTQEGDRQVLLEISTPRVGIPYTLTVDNIEDISGHPISPT